MKQRPTVLVILDGWGVAPPGNGNAITLARLQWFPNAWKTWPHAVLRASGSAVGLPPRQHGNSEAGHMNIGAGRVVQQDAVRITKAINDSSFARTPAFQRAMAHAQEHGGQMHLLGLLTGQESGHAYPRHLDALLRLTRRPRTLRTQLHLFTDGRDTPKFFATTLLQRLEKKLGTRQRIATLMGRFWGMDRAKRWSRTEAAYNALVLGRGQRAASAQAAVLGAYNRGESDEFLAPTLLGSPQDIRASRVQHGDAVIFFNLRSDRARQLAKPFVQPSFETMNQGAFQRKKVLRHLRFVALTDFGPDLPGVDTAFRSAAIRNTLSVQLADLRFYSIAESEKFAHITYFFNGGYPAPIGGERRILVPSSNVQSFDEKPEMETPRIVATVIRALQHHRYDFYAVNIASADMVGHTGNLAAGIRAVQCIDAQLAKLAAACMRAGARLIITGDHGNAEEMVEPETGALNTEHSANPVPFLICAPDRPALRLARQGKLADVAPTILALFGRAQPRGMTGHSLICR